MIDILPAGTSLTFVGPDSGYTILNRILPTGTTTSGDPRGIAFSGNVTSRLGAADGSIGGNVWFYSPGGIVVGAGAVFDVGGLVLTTNDINTTGDALFGPGGEIRFSGAADSTSAVIIENGSTINALNNGSSYVALVAPRVVQDGTVNVDGSVAYVAAEQADLTINNGLFDIAIGVGTTDANGVVHSGTTTGPASTPNFDGLGVIINADAQAIYMVAVPKNDALTMLVSGNLGYQPAASASIVNGNVVLSAGANVATTGDQSNASFAFDKTAAVSDSNIQLQNVSFGSSVSTFATNGIVAETTSAVDSIVATQNMLLEARNQIDINARGGGNIAANGNVTLRAGTDGVGGTININADQVDFGDAIISGLLVTGNLVVDASASGLDDFDTVRNNGNTGIGQDAVGGEININISDGGDLVVGGTAQFVASAQGGKGENQNGSAQGGNINLDISSGTFNVTGSTFFETHAIEAQNSKSAGNGAGLIGSDSIGGNVNLALSGGTVTTGGIFVNLGAIATIGEDSGSVQSQAGDISIVAQNGGMLTSGFSSFSAVAAGNDAGNGAGGNVFIHANNGSINFTDLVIIDASGVGGAGGSGIGGTINLRVEGAGGTLSFVNNLDISADGYIESGGEGGANFEGDGGFGFGGAVTFDLLGGTFTAGDITVGSDGWGGVGGDQVTLPMPADLTVAAGDGGDGRGGDVIFNLNGTAATVTSLSITSNGFGGNGAGGNINSGTAGGAAGSGIGGNAIFNAQSGSLTVTSTLTVSAQGNNQNLAPYGSRGAGGFGYGSDGGAGGSGVGGTATFNLDGSAAINADQVVVSTSATGGNGGSTSSAYGAQGVLMQAGVAGNGGDAAGGDATFNNNAGTLNFIQLSVTSTGTGGDGGNVFGFSAGPDNIAGSGGSGST